MIELNVVLSSDTVNRYGSRFASAEVAKGLQGHWRTGLPNLISHDAHRIVGWTLPSAVSIQPGVTRLHGSAFIPETAVEQDDLENRYKHQLGIRNARETSAHLPQLRARLAPHLCGDETVLSTEATALVGLNLARRVAPAVFTAEDHDGLVDLRTLETIQPGVFKYGELALFAHPFFRRSLSRWNSLNSAVLNSLEDLTSNQASTLRMRLDPDMVGLAASVKRVLEFDFWFGPKFNDDLSSIQTGITRHEASERERFFFGISRTEFWWQSRDDQHILEAEELRDLPTVGVGAGSFGCRYVHSIVDERNGRAFHLDGAIRAYDEAALVERLDKTIATAGRKTQYTKLWRVDGDIPLSHWKRLVHDHFRDNPLVSEYLSQTSADAPPSPSSLNSHSPRSLLKDRLVLHSTDAGDGVNFLLSFHEPAAMTTESIREAQPLETISSDGVRHDIVDADVFELRKSLRRMGQDLHIPQDALRIAFEDRYLTLPLIRHATAPDTTDTINALEALFAAWTSRGTADRAVAFTLAAPIADVEVRCSAFGHLQDLSTSFTAFRKLFAADSLEGVVAWVDEQATALRSQTDNRDADPSRFDPMMTPHATYRVTRSEIAREDLQPELVGDEKVLRVRLPENNEPLMAAVSSGSLRPAFAWVIRSSRCSKCTTSYAECSCSKVLDTDVVQQVQEGDIAYAFWTDRPA